jgi:hypothetical protein
MNEYEIGKCYQITFDDETELVFRYVGAGTPEQNQGDQPSIPVSIHVVEVDGGHKKLHKLLEGRTVRRHIEIDCADFE